MFWSKEKEKKQVKKEKPYSETTTAIKDINSLIKKRIDEERIIKNIAMDDYRAVILYDVWEERRLEELEKQRSKEEER